jgi:hypothetical protein
MKRLGAAGGASDGCAAAVRECARRLHASASRRHGADENPGVPEQAEEVARDDGDGDVQRAVLDESSPGPLGG